jgi:hypothetical protein
MESKHMEKENENIYVTSHLQSGFIDVLANIAKE